MLNNYYFTFGSDERFPYQNTYIIIKADNINVACDAFLKKFPSRDGTRTLNCAFVYPEHEWKGSINEIAYKTPADIFTATDILVNKPRLFVDMDGTLTEWRTLRFDFDKYEDKDRINHQIQSLLKTPGYFYTLKPHENIIDAIKQMITEDKVDIYILSCVLPNTEKGSPTQEKIAWLQKYLPELDKSHYIFVPDGKNKVDYIPCGQMSTDYLFDDYSLNLHRWDRSGQTAIKYLNGKNGTKGTFQGNKISYERSAEEIANLLTNICTERQMIIDEVPPQIDEEFDTKILEDQFYEEWEIDN